MPLSLYLHVPFCDTLCWFCGCHTKIVNHYSPLASYLDLLLKEIEAVAAIDFCAGDKEADKAARRLAGAEETGRTAGDHLPLCPALRRHRGAPARPVRAGL